VIANAISIVDEDDKKLLRNHLSATLIMSCPVFMFLSGEMVSE